MKDTDLTLDLRPVNKRAHGIDRKRLIKALGYKDGKLPVILKYNPISYPVQDMFKSVLCVPVYDSAGQFIIFADVVIKMRYTGEKPRSGVHRVFIECSHCKKLIPFGRYLQHVKRKDHRNAV